MLRNIFPQKTQGCATPPNVPTLSHTTRNNRVTDAKKLIVRLMGTDVDPDVSRAYRDQQDAWMDNHTTAVGDFVDSLATETGYEIDNILITLKRGEGSTTEQSERALRVVAWHTLALPYKPDNKHYLDTGALLPLIELTPKSLYMFAVHIMESPNIGVYIKLLQLDAAIAQDYFAYCIQFLYAHPGHDSENNVKVVYADDEDQY